MITKTCAISGKKFVITDDDLKFYEKMSVPAPTLCPEERQRRRVSYRNFRNLYQRKCDATGETIITMYHADQPFPVYKNDYWWSDHWDAIEHGQDFDFSREFFPQYHELAQKVPRFSTFNINCENCHYSNMAWGSKDCYLVFGCVRDEDCLYGHIVWDSKDCVDNLYAFRCEWCSECVDCVDCYDVHFSTECANCNESYFLHDCRGCNNCFGCTNLRNKQYWFMNEPLSKEAYEKKISEIFPLTRDTIATGKNWLEKTKREQCVFPESFGVKNENVSGNHIYESKNCHHAFDTKKSEDSNFLYTSYDQTHSYDISFSGMGSKFSIECLTMGDAEDCRFCHNIGNSNNIDYSEFCFYSENLFGCNGLQKKKHCVLNKQYTAQEYEKLKEKIIAHMKETGEWGEFFPIKNSPFAYNESIIQEYFPLKKSAVTSQGWHWKDSKVGSKYLGEKYELPESIEQVPNDICEKVLTCQKTGKNYKIQKAELKFYQKMKLPLPLLCPDARHEERMKLRNPRKLWERKCSESGVTIHTSFAPDRPEKVLCEECYLKHVH